MDPVTEALAKVGALLELPGLAIQAATRGPQVKIEFARAQGWSGQMAENELRRLHIPICGRGFTKTTLCLYVRKRQAVWAEYVLRRAGCPVLTVMDSRNAQWAEGKGPVPAWDEKECLPNPKTKQGLLTRLLDWLVNG